MLSFLPFIAEFILLIVALAFSFRLRFTLKKAQITNWLVISLLVFSTILGVIEGGAALLGAALKITSFILILHFAIQRPKLARNFLFLVIFIFFCVQLEMGNFYGKLTPIPFLLVASFWSAGAFPTRSANFPILYFGFFLEVVQSIFLESRGLLLSCVFVLFVFLMPLRVIRRSMPILAISLPVIYPLALTAVFAMMISGGGLIEMTSSNFERSAMASWSLINLGNFPLIGPGVEHFTEEINVFKVIEQHGILEKYDPHHFLLSIWLFVGTVSILLLYFLWCSIWLSVLKKISWTDERARYFAILGIVGVLGFTLSPPDSLTRMHVALLVGISIAGLRDCGVLAASDRLGRNIAQSAA